MEENDEKEKENPEESNSFYSSYNEAMQGDGKVLFSVFVLADQVLCQFGQGGVIF